MLKEKDKWHKIRRRLNKTGYKYDADWDTAISLLENRLSGKYFEPIAILLERDKKRGVGFSIVTILCALIETLAAFKKGKIHNCKYQEGKDPNYQYKDSMELFCDFLKNEPPFSKYFKNDFKADDFYSNVRCALMHDCRIKNNWIIRTRKNKGSTLFFEKSSNQKIIYRTTLFEQLRDVYFAQYIASLKEEKNIVQRRFLARKLDHLFEYNRKQEFDWWKEDKTHTIKPQRMI